MLHVDNSAVRIVAAKLGVGRLRHISGRMMWMQQLLRSKDIEIQQSQPFSTLQTRILKGLHERFFVCMIGYVNGNGRVGETEYGRMQAMMKSQINGQSSAQLAWW